MATLYPNTLVIWRDLLDKGGAKYLIDISQRSQTVRREFLSLTKKSQTMKRMKNLLDIISYTSIVMVEKVECVDDCNPFLVDFIKDALPNTSKLPNSWRYVKITAFTKEFYHTGTFDPVSLAVCHYLGLIDVFKMNTKLDQSRVASSESFLENLSPFESLQRKNFSNLKSYGYNHFLWTNIFLNDKNEIGVVIDFTFGTNKKKKMKHLKVLVKRVGRPTEIPLTISCAKFIELLSASQLKGLDAKMSSIARDQYTVVDPLNFVSHQSL